LSVFGLHWIDIAIILSYLIGMIYIGKKLSKTIKGETDFYLAGRKLGKFTQFFLVFGNMTDASSATSVTSVIFRQGISGVWLHLQLIFITPFYWFYNVWFRRVRLISSGDIFIDRFNSKLLAGIYAFTGIIATTLFVGMGYIASAKTLQAILVKPAEEYTVAEKQTILDFKEYNKLKEQYKNLQLADADKDRYQLLDTKFKKGEIRGYVSYLPNDPIWFYVLYGVSVSIYVISGGFSAAAITNIFQGVLIIFFSVILIPLGLFKLGGFSGLHEKVPEHMFQLASNVDLGEFSLLSIISLVFLVLISYCGGTGIMSGSGSAKDELTARVGVVTGAFTKRIMTIAWMLCGLIAVGLYSSTLSDADESWGLLTKDLLGVGSIGLMITGILAANMSSMDATSLNTSALFVRNIYAPLLPNRSEKHYILIGRVCILAVLGLGIVIALKSQGLVSLMKLAGGLGTALGGAVLLIFIWRRITMRAVLYTTIIHLVLIAVIPNIAQEFDFFRQSKKLTTQTPERIVKYESTASLEDVEEGLADKVGDDITKEQVIAPWPVYFEKVIRVDDDQGPAKMEGRGRFHIEVYMANLIGIDVENFPKASLMATWFFVDGILPMLLLIVFSLITRQTTDKELIDRFYVKMKTPVGPTPEEDAAELEKSYANPTRFDHQKLFAKSNIEICKWTRQDWAGFLLSWVAVGAIIILLKVLVSIGR